MLIESSFVLMDDGNRFKLASDLKYLRQAVKPILCSHVQLFPSSQNFLRHGTRSVRMKRLL